MDLIKKCLSVPKNTSLILETGFNPQTNMNVYASLPGGWLKETKECKKD
ncbi:hypothetical protein [Methanosarcina sp. DH2]|nr:hypothetical protein [Methanosarcina sp. DH2]